MVAPSRPPSPPPPLLQTVCSYSTPRVPPPPARRIQGCATVPRTKDRAAAVTTDIAAGPAPTSGAPPRRS